MVYREKLFRYIQFLINVAKLVDILIQQLKRERDSKILYFPYLGYNIIYIPYTMCFMENIYGNVF